MLYSQHIRRNAEVGLSCLREEEHRCDEDRGEEEGGIEEENVGALEEKDLKDSIYLSNLFNETLRNRVLKFLENYSHVCTSSLCTIKETEHLINLKESPIHIRENPYRAGKKS